uniref:Uncharacterized protein n=1 Tax=Oryza nivara TaxID=4536 RepID=A0A0E0ITG2_ORYNI
MGSEFRLGRFRGELLSYQKKKKKKKKKKKREQETSMNWTMTGPILKSEYCSASFAVQRLTVLKEDQMDLSFFHAQSKSPACVMIGLSAHCIKALQNLSGQADSAANETINGLFKKDIRCPDWFFPDLVFNGPVPFPVWNSDHLNFFNAREGQRIFQFV